MPESPPDCKIEETWPVPTAPVVGLCGTGAATTGAVAGRRPWFVPRRSPAGRRHTRTAEAGEQGP
ncbi:hypothetical protein GCM10010106_35230 [Thermopolyspora flexuosa]|nr:hypothetical protein GCM10010106_35230 [Thermopolyspora flexuosa]